MCAVLNLDPVLRPPRLIRSIPPLRHQPLQVEFARLAKQIRPDLALLERGEEISFSENCASVAFALYEGGRGIIRTVGGALGLLRLRQHNFETFRYY